MRIALWCWYRGDGFRGFQRQPLGPTVQESIEQALGRFAHPVRVMASGRTDRGVHARMQVVGFRAPAGVDCAALAARLRSELPPGLGLIDLRVAPPSFHPQFSAWGKEYRYRVNTGEVPAWEGLSWNPATDERLQGRRLDLSIAISLLQGAVGTRDFIAFHEKSSPRRLRTLAEVRHFQEAPGVTTFALVGSGFGRHQVRFLVGSAVACAAGLFPPEDFLRALEDGTPIPGIRAPASALTLWEVFYPPPVDPFPPDLRRTAGGLLPPHPPFTGS